MNPDDFPVAVLPTALSKLVPSTFDGRDAWFLYLRPPSQTDRYDLNLSIVARDVLNDRYHLLSGGQVRVNLNANEWLACRSSSPSPSPSPSLFDAWAWAYANGMSAVGCEEMDMCEPGQVRCHPSPRAKRLFFPSAIYHVTTPAMTWVEKINAIQYDLAKWGPVAARMKLYENFFNGWASTTPYTSPAGKLIGEHYITIVGWKGEEWICRNTWGSGWGLLGYFTIRMNCGVELEDHVAAVWPQLPWTGSLDLFQGKLRDSIVQSIYQAVPATLREQQARLQIDPITGYTAEALRQVQEGVLEGDLTPIIPFPSQLPSPTTFWAIDVLDMTRLNVTPVMENVIESRLVDHVLLALIVVCGAFTAWAAYQGNSTKKPK